MMTHAINLETRIRASAEQVSTEVDDEAVILELKNTSYYGLNTIGTDIWRFIQDERRVYDIVAHIVDLYDVTEEQCRADILTLLSELCDHDLVTIVGPSHDD